MDCTKVYKFKIYQINGDWPKLIFYPTKGKESYKLDLRFLKMGHLLGLRKPQKAVSFKEPFKSLLLRNIVLTCYFQSQKVKQNQVIFFPIIWPGFSSCTFSQELREALDVTFPLISCSHDWAFLLNGQKSYWEHSSVVVQNPSKDRLWKTVCWDIDLGDG